jgi:biotin carboxyl carrier protein
MKLIAGIADERVSLDVRREGARVIAEAGGRRYELEAHEPEPGVYVLLYGGRVYECRVGRTASAGGASEREAYEVHLLGRSYSVALSDPKHLRGARSSGADTSGRAEVLAPMPGKVVRVLVEAGARVEAGDGLLIVEAMKMQNEMKSPKAGTIVELRAQAGSTVNAGEVLAVVE